MPLAADNGPDAIAWHACNRHGAMQRVDEFGPALAAVKALDPKVIVEIGCGNGGTLWAWRQLGAEVLAISLPVLNPDALLTHGASLLFGDSRDPASMVWLTGELCDRPVDVLHIDGDHRYDGVRADFEAYSPLVRPGGLVLLHDIANTRDPDMGVPTYWRELREQRDAYEIVSPRRPLGLGIVRI